ncbi:MAG: Ku protein, partial [Gammaproteobacteria bacterium]|nr:Ku protein [Gammaproteobacteria bacterium]
KEEELELALTIIEQRVNEKFQPENYEDEVRSRMMELIQQKVDGQEISVPPEEAPESKIVDLMEALKASVNAKGDRKSARRVGKRAAARSTAKGVTKPAGKGRKRSSG